MCRGPQLGNHWSKACDETHGECKLYIRHGTTAENRGVSVQSLRNGGGQYWSITQWHNAVKVRTHQENLKHYRIPERCQSGALVMEGDPEYPSMDISPMTQYQWTRTGARDANTIFNKNISKGSTKLDLAATINRAAHILDTYNTIFYKYINITSEFNRGAVKTNFRRGQRPLLS